MCTHRLFTIAHNVVRPTQTAFMLGRIFFREWLSFMRIHELHTNKLDGIIFKVDIEMVYNKVKCSFLQHALCMKGFAAE